LIQYYLNGRRPDQDQLERLATALNVDSRWLLHGKVPEESSGIRQVPVINVAACGNWKDATDLDYPVGVAHGYEPMRTDDPHAFFVVAEGDSMTGPYSKSRRVEPGDLLLVEPGQAVNNGDIVFARHRDNGVTVKKFFKRDDGSVELRPINPDYQSIIVPAGETFVAYRITRITTKV
jgi:SOS-response transcriptional repressor LexA